jgi:predicted secreted protein
MKKLTEKFNSIAVKKGELFMVELETNGASTGYLWEFNVTAGKAAHVNKVYVDPHAVPGEMSCGNTINEQTIMRAEESGVIEIMAEYRRPWEKSAPPLKSRSFRVTVE